MTDGEELEISTIKKAFPKINSRKAFLNIK